MTSVSSTERPMGARNVKVTGFSPGDLDARIHDAVARRAFEIGESRKFAPGHQAEDWRRAESELIRPLNCGFLISNDKIEVNTDAACFDKGEIEICSAPQRLVICGLQRRCKAGQLPEMNGWIFRFLDLPMEVIPSLVAARFKGRHLEIDLPIAQRIPPCAVS